MAMPRKRASRARLREEVLSPRPPTAVLQDLPGERLRDPISGEIGKSIVFAVSQNHAAKLTQSSTNGRPCWPGKYQSDFAVQVTSQIPDAQQYTINFTNNNLLGSANFLDAYKTSKARVCVTVGMMTTGYDCPDILNLGLMRPIFSPSDFVQIKGRGTRKHDFREQLFDEALKAQIGKQPHQDRLQALRLLRQLRILRREVRLRRSAQTAPARCWRG
jgi:hypothetical protein